MDTNLSLLSSVFNHLVLPPKVPGAQDADIDAVSYDVLMRLIHATNTAIGLTCDIPWRGAYENLEKSLQACLQLNRGRLERSSLLEHFKALGSDHVLTLYLNEQNAGLIIRREEQENDEYIVFESFEASAVSASILAAGHAVEWDFPGRSVRISVEDFAEESFQKSLASFLEQASMESLYYLQASTRKAGVSIGEIRDTTDPALVTQMLMSLLEAVGSPYYPPVLRKRVRDDVNLVKGNIPWRRLPFWLILRVMTQRQLCLTLGPEQGQVSYKILMAIILAELLNDTAGRLSPHEVVCLRAKLARRMAKLEMMETLIQLRKDSTYNDCFSTFSTFSTLVGESLENATLKMQGAWNAFKINNARRILPLPYRAPTSSLTLTLPNSGPFLDEILSRKLPRTSMMGPADLPNPLDQSIQRSQQFTDHAFEFAALEEGIEQQISQSRVPMRNGEDHCLELCSQINSVLGRMRREFKSVDSTYSSDPELKSATLLAIFTLWVELDKAAIRRCNLLAGHAPVFHPELLDVLQLPTKSAMERLQKIQEHLANRHARSTHSTIFEVNTRDSFALRYLTTSNHLQSLERRIQIAYENACEQKKQEHEELCNEYDQHTEGNMRNPCLCTFEDGKRIVAGCTSCWHWRMRSRLEIRVQEAFLPENNPTRDTVVFELGIPEWFSAYRDTTWRMMSMLAHPYRPQNASRPELFLRKYEPLQRFMEGKVHGLAMASKIKCFEQTHYTFSREKVPLSRVLLPFAAHFELYDSESNIWVENLTKQLTLEHHCGISIPRALQSILFNSLHPPTVVDGPSSYQIQANQVIVPPDIPAQAFYAYQKLFAGKRRRWPNIIVELSSSNLNLSDEDTTRVICQLALQAGPRLPKESLRGVHEIFKYPAFTRRLTSILENLLGSIQSNWREHNTMQLVISLALRLYQLSGQSIGAEILESARKYLIGWIAELRKKAQSTHDSTEAQRYATYGLYAALHCRATFAILLESDDQLGKKDLAEWIQASIAVQENTLHDLDRLPSSLKNLLFRDAKMVYHLQAHIKGAMESFKSTVGAELIRASCNQFSAIETGSVAWTFLPEPQSRWVSATTPGPFRERIHFNYIEGHLLVNGKPRSKLPLNIAEDGSVKLIFGDQHLLTYPSSLPGMSHRLTRPRGEHQVHFGSRDGRAIIRTVRQNKISGVDETLEFIPSSNLRNLPSFDLPAELVDNCGHWLNVNTQCLEIRRASPKTADFWKTKQKDWFVHIPGRKAYRGIHGSQLVDPQSEVFVQIASIFCDFEQPDRLTVFQPQSQKGNLSVELKHFDLSFAVNQNNLLECQQLNAEIDRNQDAGTWYGLRSKIVMKEIRTRARSIIVPLGKPVTNRNGIHVDVRIHRASHYARFMIDDILGRITCNPEPRLLYTKALYHAVTSFCLPDTLTGRTGSSESFTILRSGTAQPWTPISKAANEIFEYFIDLAPRRQYHPPDVKRIQKVLWDVNLTSSIQCDGYKEVIEAIKKRSNNLAIFSPDSEFQVKDVEHLCRRGNAQRLIYDPLLDIEAGQPPDDKVYSPRDRRCGSEAAQVYQISRVILSRCSQFYMSTTLRSILESFEIVGGFSLQTSEIPMPSTAPLINQIEDPTNEKWGELVDFCRRGGDKGSLLFRLGLLAFNRKANMDLVHSLATFCFIDEVRSLDPPRYQYFANLQSSERPSIDLLEGLISSAYPVFKPVLNRKGRESRFDANNRDDAGHAEACKKEGIALAASIQSIWPVSADDMTTETLRPALNGPIKDTPEFLIDISSAWDRIKPEWQRRFANVELINYINQVDHIITSRKGRVQDDVMPTPWTTTGPVFATAQGPLSYQSIVEDFTSKSGPHLTAFRSTLHEIVEEHKQKNQTENLVPESLDELTELTSILGIFEQSGNSLRRQYARDLSQSLAALYMTTRQPEPKIMASTIEYGVFSESLRQAQTHMKNTRTAIDAAFTVGDNRAYWLNLGAMKPLSTTTDLLKLLRSTKSVQFGSGMKEAIAYYGLTITDAQHLVRIQHALSRGDRHALSNELREEAHNTWKAIEKPDWLLLEIDSNILIRAEQVAVAGAMTDPALGNGVLQLSMGKGKTSCIIPMAAAVLANGRDLLRVVVPKALIMQTAQTIQSRLGDLVGREVVHIPYSRRTTTETEVLDLYSNLHRETWRCHGIVLTCAEHILSYKLSGWQKFIDSKMTTASYMIKFQNWLDTHCRDVLDECDYTLSVKTQLNYPSGSEMSVDFHPYRWETIQDLLGLIDGHFRELHRKHPGGIQVTWRREGFPTVQFLKAETENALHDLVIKDVCSGRLTLLRPTHPKYQQKREAVREVLCGPKVSDKLLDRVAKLFENPNVARDALVLIRGLLLQRIIILCLSKRWNVHYGLHPDRDPIAVPYEAKGKPSEQAEYGHADVSILFTCLSFYYAGLTHDQLVQGVQHILQSNDPAAQYECLISTCTQLPPSLRRWSVINTDDRAQMEKLWSSLRTNRIAINHYLNHFVFPVHARQFEVKLQACAWDLPICPENAMQITRTSGFSGTNDNRFVLPLTISQRDLAELQHTSAEVLSYLLQNRNRQFHSIPQPQPQRNESKERCFLADLKAKGVSVLIDAGAYISEMANEELAQTWLKADSDAKAVIYFRNDNRAWVHYRSNAKEDVPLLATPFAEDLSGCNVFLDQGHTRGVDLRLPPNARGAVTLALKLTKDHTVQAAMRLRQLRTTQSICFYGPQAVESSIRDFHKLDLYDRINSSHVVPWLLEQTCRSIEDVQGLYVAQGIDFCQRTDVIWNCKSFMTKSSERQKLFRTLKQPERKTLQQLYGPAPEIPAISSHEKLTSLQLRSFMKKLALISKEQRGKTQSDALQEVEQEREVEVQVEQVRQSEKRKRYTPLKYPGMHPDIIHFARNGVLENPQSSNLRKPGFEHAFSFVARTVVGQRFDVHETSSRLFVSKEFTNTVHIAQNSHEGDNFLRPVEWIIWSPETETALVIIPEEAEYYMEFLRSEQRQSHTHLIAYATPVTKAMVHFNKLDFYSYPELPAGSAFPERIRIELGILAGRLYLHESEWTSMAAYVKGSPNDPDKIAADPAAFLLEWLSIRRRAVNVLHTHMGFICTGRQLETTDSSEDVGEE